MTFVAPIEDKGSICPAAVLRCIDWRWREADQEFITKELGFANFDLYSWPGGGKEILQDNGFKKAFVEHVVSISRNLHKIKKLVILWHWECDKDKINLSPSAKEEKCQADLAKVQDLLQPELPEDLEIILAYSKITPQGLEYVVVE